MDAFSSASYGTTGTQATGSSSEYQALLAHQTVSLSFKEEHIRCSSLLRDKVVISFADPEVTTLHELFLHGLKASNGGPCLGWRPKPSLPYIWISYQKVLDRCQRFGSGLAAEGIQFNQSQMIGLFADNRIEWKIVEQTCCSFSMIVVPIFSKSTSDVIEHICKKCALSVMVVDTVVNAAMLMKNCLESKISLKLIIVMDELDDYILGLSAKSNVIVRWFREIEDFGRLSLKAFVPPQPASVHSITFTCGTTGLPKGIAVTHTNVIAAHAGITLMGNETFLNLSESDVYISYLHLSQMFEQVLSTAIYFVGGSVGFYQGDMTRLLDDIAVLKPTVFPVVPRVMNRLYEKITALPAKFPYERWLIRLALKMKKEQIRRGIVAEDSFWDKFVLRKFHELLGGRLKLCIGGASHISSKVVNFARVSLGVVFTEMYGLTETTGGVLLNLPGSHSNSSVGSPILCNYVKLTDIPQKNIYARNGVGEICVKGCNVFQGYYRDEEMTQMVFDEEGWFHTGDVGLWLPNGALEVLDRISNIIKLCEGVYIAPEKIEGILVQSKAVSEVFVYGDTNSASIVGIVHTEANKMASWGNSKGIYGTTQELLNSKKMNELILKDLHAIGKTSGLLPFELPKKIFLTPAAFSVENDLLTPTFLKKRIKIYQRYETEIKSLLDQS